MVPAICRWPAPLTVKIAPESMLRFLMVAIAPGSSTGLLVVLGMYTSLHEREGTCPSDQLAAVFQSVFIAPVQ